MSASSEASNHEDAINQFMAITGAEQSRAQNLLEACSWNLELAVNMHVDMDDGRANNNTRSANAASGPSASSSRNISNPRIPGNDSSLDIIEEPISRPPSSAFNTAGANGPRSRVSSRRAGPHGNSSSSSSASAYQSVDGVRPPMRPFRDQIVESPIGYLPNDYSGQIGSSSSTSNTRRYNSRSGATLDSYDAFRDFKAEADWQEAAMADDDNEGSSNHTSNHPRTLHELFRPPLDLMFRGSLDSAREAGTDKNKWLLVNIQDGREFNCQTLNRDVWSNATVKDIVKEHFIFWQVNFDSFDGARYVQFYNVRGFPHLSIIDPRTGEQMRSWPTNVDHSSFCDSVIDFLNENPTPDNRSSKPPVIAPQTSSGQEHNPVKSSKSRNDGVQKKEAIIDEISDLDDDETEADSDDQTEEEDYIEFVKDVKKASENIVAQNSAQSSKVNKKESVEDYRKYLGTDTERMSELVVRFPDGTRKPFQLPSDSLMKALFLMLSSEGYDMNQYNYVTTFPRRLLHELAPTDTLSEAKLIKENIIVERKLD